MRTRMYVNYQVTTLNAGTTTCLTCRSDHLTQSQFAFVAVLSDVELVAVGVRYFPFAVNGLDNQPALPFTVTFPPRYGDVLCRISSFIPNDMRR